MAIPWGAIALGAGSIGSSLLGGGSKKSGPGFYKQRRQAKDEYRLLLKDWQKYAFPNAGAINAEQKSGQNALAQAFKGLPSKVFSQSASRGFGPGSGLTMKSMGDVQGSYMNALAQMITNLAKFKNTPQWSAPSSIGGSAMPQQITGSNPWNEISDLFGTGMGFSLMNSMINSGGANQGSFQQPMTNFSTPFGAQFGVANPKYGW